jgi:hypothetical protein
MCQMHIHFIKNQLMHLLQTLFYIHIKTLKLVKKCSLKGVIYKNPTCFGHYSMTIFRDRSSFLVNLLLFSCLLRHLSFLGFVAVCHLFVCVSGVAVCVLSGRALHDQTAHKQVHWIHIQTEGIRPHTNTNI